MPDDHTDTHADESTHDPDGCDVDMTADPVSDEDIDAVVRGG